MGYSTRLCIDKERSGAGTKHQLFELFLTFSESVDQKQWENAQGGVKSWKICIWATLKSLWGNSKLATERLRDSKWKKILKDFGECHENSLIESFKMSPHLICLSWGLRSLLWPASGSGLDVIWKLIPQLRHIKWGLILKLSLRPFLSHPWKALRFFLF